MAGGQFSPQHAVVSPGATVRWRNDDTTFHLVVADDGTWASPALAPGGEYTHTFDNPGFYPYHCEFHPEMQGRAIAGSARYLPIVLRNAVPLRRHPRRPPLPALLPLRS